MSLGSEGVPFTMPVEPVGTSNNNGNNGGWGGDWGAWIILFLIFGMFGWGGMGGFGFGGFGGMGGGAYPVESILQRSLDTQTIIGKLDGVSQGICNLGYDQLSQMNNISTQLASGFSGIGNAICNSEYQNAQLVNGINTNMMQGFNSANVVALQNQNALASQLASCCCDQRTGMLQMQSNIDGHFCTTNYNNQANTTSIIQNAHNDTDRVLARLDAMENARKDERIAQLQSELQTARFQASQNAQNEYISAVGNSVVSKLQPPTPVPSYQVPNPFTGCCGVPTCGGCAC